ncbi:fungal cellulose binding domain-containing protein [Desarmillaria ectypa]|nr:fungal cellulose binding domain-containing protein [Desarmillaria ectypa]
MFPQVYFILLAAVLGAKAQKYWFSLCVLQPSTIHRKLTTRNSSGDSYTQTGFNTTGTLPAVGNALGNPPYPGWTSTGGQNWVDYVTTVDNTSLVLTYNLAYGGATISADLVTPYEPTVLSLTDQINQFMDSYASKPSTTPWTSANTLFSVWIGINDIGGSFSLGGDRDAFSDTLHDAYFALVEKLHFCAFIPTRSLKSYSSQSLEKSVIEGFNRKLTARAASLEANHSDVTTWIWDSNAAFTPILDDPTSYGFKDATSSGNGADIFWSDAYHPSSYAHAYFGQDVAKVLGGFI